MSIAVPKPGLREANSIEADDKDAAVAAYYQQYGAAQCYYGQAGGAGKGPAVLVSSQVGFPSLREVREQMAAILTVDDAVYQCKAASLPGTGLRV